MKRILIILFLSISGCSAPANVNLTLLDTTIKSAIILHYIDLTDEEKKQIGSYAKFYRENENWNKGTKFEPSTAFYVRAIIRRKELAIVSSMYSCGSALQCSQSQIDNKVSKLLSYSNPLMLYGKYKNRWKFSTESGVMPQTERFDGHRLINIDQSNDNKLDEVLIGPLPQIPISLIITPYDGYKDDYYIRYNFQGMKTRLKKQKIYLK